MGEWDQNRADITGRKIQANIPPAVMLLTTRQTLLMVLAIGVPLAAAIAAIFVFGR